MEAVPKIKANFSGVSLKTVMRMLGQTNFMPWQIAAPPRPPSAFLEEAILRFDVFDLTSSEAAKVVIIDELLAEIVRLFPLRVWKAAPLESERFAGIADYLIAPKRAYLDTPILCAVEAKKDNFEQGRAQCVAEMAACQFINTQEKAVFDVFGIVSNGQDWQFYKLTLQNSVWESAMYPLQNLPELLGALHHVCAECAKNAVNELNTNKASAV